MTGSLFPRPHALPPRTTNKCRPKLEDDSENPGAETWGNVLEHNVSLAYGVPLWAIGAYAAAYRVTIKEIDSF